MTHTRSSIIESESGSGDVSVLVRASGFGPGEGPDTFPDVSSDPGLQVEFVYRNLVPQWVPLVACEPIHSAGPGVSLLERGHRENEM